MRITIEGSTEELTALAEEVQERLKKTERFDIKAVEAAVRIFCETPLTSEQAVRLAQWLDRQEAVPLKDQPSEVREILQK